MFVISNFVASVTLEITQSTDQVRIRLLSQLIKQISRVLQKLLKYFTSTAILTSFALSAAGSFSSYFYLGFK